MGQLRLMAVFAHPDDEAFGSGGTLSRYAAEGVDVYLVTATRGESGGIAEPDVATPASLPQVRERELRCACDIYGIHPPRFLDYVDGQLTIVNQGQAVARLVSIIRELRPQVLITFGPDGIYGHYDHIAVHRWASIAVELANDPDCFPGQLPGDCHPHRVDKLYYRTMSLAQIEAMSGDEGPAAVVMDGVPFCFVGRRDEEISTVIDVSDYGDIKMQGIRCHVTQVGRDGPFVDLQEDLVRENWFHQEHYVLAQSTVGQPDGVETDLFAGLR